MKHVPERTCIVCREQRDKNSLLRIVKDPDGSLTYDGTGRAPGRGAYVCASEKCISELNKKRVLNRVYKQQLPDDVYTELTKELEAAIRDGK